jgi:hypothetical protein
MRIGQRNNDSMTVATGDPLLSRSLNLPVRGARLFKSIALLNMLSVRVPCGHTFAHCLHPSTELNDPLNLRPLFGR